MARRTPFAFRDHYDPAEHTHLPDGMIERLINEYEEALLVEYKSGDVDVASFHEGLREATEGVLVDLLGIEQSVMDAYWQRDTTRPEPESTFLPMLSDPDNWLITYEQVEEWTGQRLDAEQWDALNEAIPNTSIPETIDMIVKHLPQ